MQQSQQRAPKSNIYLNFRLQPSIINSCSVLFISKSILHHYPSLILSLSMAFLCLQRTFQQEVLYLKNDIAAQREPIIISCEVALNLPTLKHKQSSSIWAVKCSSYLLPIGGATYADANGPRKWCLCSDAGRLQREEQSSFIKSFCARDAQVPPNGAPGFQGPRLSVAFSFNLNTSVYEPLHVTVKSVTQAGRSRWSAVSCYITVCPLH